MFSGQSSEDAENSHSQKTMQVKAEFDWMIYYCYVVGFSQHSSPVR